MEMAVTSGAVRRIKVKVQTLDIAPLRSESPPQKRSGMARVLMGFHSFTCTPTRSSAIGMSHACLCLPKPQLVLIYRPRRDGRLSRPWCEVAQAEIRTRNLPIANLTLYHTATSAHKTGKALFKPSPPIYQCFLRGGCPSCNATNSVEALKGKRYHQ